MPCGGGGAGLKRPTAHARGIDAEALAATLLQQEGWTILDRRVRTGAGELDLVAARDGMLAFIEVKQRATLGEAAIALSVRQRARLLAGAEAWLANHADEGRRGIRFDVIVVDRTGRARRIVDAFRVGD
jgi:putative endonuclease